MDVDKSLQIIKQISHLLDGEIQCAKTEESGESGITAATDKGHLPPFRYSNYNSVSRSLPTYSGRVLYGPSVGEQSPTFVFRQFTILTAEQQAETNP